MQPLVAIIPTVTIFGPAAVLALLFPALFGGLALLTRRWLALLTVASLLSTLYLLSRWFQGRLLGTPWATPSTLWIGFAVITIAGLVWAWRRRSRCHESSGPPPSRWEVFLLGLVGALGAGALLGHAVGISALGFLWEAFPPLWIVAWSGGLYLVLAHLFESVSPARLPSAEEVMLGTLLAVCVAGAVAPSPSPPAGAAIEVAWIFEQPERGAVVSSPLIDGERLFVAAIRDTGFGSSGAVYCLDRATGKPRWTFDDSGRMLRVYSSPCLAEGRLFVGEGMHADRRCTLHCLDAETGHELWRFATTDHIESSPTAADGCVYFGAGDEGVHCLDARTGTSRWQFRGDLHVDAGPTVAGGLLFAGSGVSRRHRKTEAFCLNAETGRPLWEAGTALPVWATPAVAGDDVYVPQGNGRLDRSASPPEQPAGAILCLDVHTGHERWHFRVPDAVHARAAVDERYVYFGCRDGACYALDRRDGRLCWRQDVGSPVATRLALLDGALYAAASAGQLYCLNASTGTPEWTFDLARYSQTRARLFASPAVAVPAGDDHPLIYQGGEFSNPVSSAAAVYCLRDVAPMVNRSHGPPP
jgi:outer membrane protein assembly factor BamB